MRDKAQAAPEEVGKQVEQREGAPKHDTQTRQQQRLEALGALASGVAHEINNPIQSIMNYAQLIRNRGKSPQLDEYAGEILCEAQRVATIVRNLLSFARQEGEPYMEASMADMVEHTLSLTAAVLRKEQISVEVRVNRELPLVQCHPQQIQQTIMNLVTFCRDGLNARYPNADTNKRLLIAAVAESWRGQPALRTIIEDRSAGMPPEALERLFDPFDSVASQRGAGLGLSVCYSIVTDHGGALTVESELGHFTRFVILLPLPQDGT